MGWLRMQVAGCRRAFTLVELLVVISIIALLVALLLPGVQAAREAGRRMSCVNNLKQIGLALHSYHQTHERLPGGSIYNYESLGTKGSPTWAVSIFPHLELQPLFDRLDFTHQIYDSANQAVVTTVIPTYACPTDPQSSRPILKARTNAGFDNPSESMGLWYTTCMGPTVPDQCPFCSDTTPSATNWCCQGYSFGTTKPAGNSVGMFGRHPRGFSFEQVTDGLSNTLMAGETLPGDCVFNCVFCVNFPVTSTSIPLNTFVSDQGIHAIYYKTSGYKSLHPGGANVVMGDGSVHFLKATIDFRLYNNLGTRSGNEVVQLPE